MHQAGHPFLVDEPSEVVVRLPGLRQLEDSPFEPPRPRHLRLSQCQRYARLPHDPVKLLVEPWLPFPAQVEVHSAKPGVMQGIDEVRAHFIDEPHQRLRFRHRPLKARLAVAQREGPLHLLGRRRPVEVPGVMGDGERPVEPPFVEPGAVRVRARHHEPRRVQPIRQVRICDQVVGKEVDGHRAHRLVGVRASDEDGPPPALPHPQHSDGVARPGVAEHGPLGDPRRLRRQPAGPCLKLFDPKKPPVIGHPAEDLRKRQPLRLFRLRCAHARQSLLPGRRKRGDFVSRSRPTRLSKASATRCFPR